MQGSSHNSHSVNTFVRSLSQHAESASRHVETGTHAANSISIGEVESRTHTETESQDHFESASRVFSNPNKCHALTFYFFRINKSQTVRWTLESIERHVIDAAAPTSVESDSAGGGGRSVSHPGRDPGDCERSHRSGTARARQCAGRRRPCSKQRMAARAELGEHSQSWSIKPPLPAKARDAALAAVDKELAAAGLLIPRRVK